MKPSATMLTSASYAALGTSGRSALRIILEEIGAAGGPVELSAVFFIQAGLSATAVKTDIADLVTLDFIRVVGTGTAARSFSMSEGWRRIADRAEAERRLAEAKAAAASRVPARQRAAPAKAAADDGGGGRLPEGVRRAVWPQFGLAAARV
jgi:hypothetical protein